MDDSEVLMSEFIDELCFQFKLVYKITLTRRYIVDLDSSTEKKFSRHLIVHLPNDELFENAQAAGLFAKRLVTRLADDLADGTLEKRHATLGRYLFVKTKDPTKTACFVDLGVYTRNRLFRLMGSSKFGKSASASLRISAANQFQFPSNFTNSSFYVPDMAQAAPSSKSLSNHDEFCRSLQWENHANALAITLVVPANASKMKFPILPSYSDNESSDITKVLLTSQSISSCSVIASRPTTASMKASGQSPIPKLDAFILTTVGKRGGVEGRIRAWSVEFTDGNYHLTYQMCENRWCERIGRHHKSNNIMWTVDLTKRACWQACHDSDCRGFRGSVVQFTDLHEDILAEIDEFLFDRELETLDITQVVACSQQNGNDEFEDALIDQAIRDIDMHVVSPDAKKISHDNEFDDDEVDRALQNLELPAMS
ncbi:hypothetical protein ACHAWO_012736 [Cyclotella atomus]|uniref:DNA-directed primase/polymerase protein n=1 Tax=Cyclotella atomus TaxID=382360 RepID=A0ABD3NJQ6_9STRA